MKGKANMATPTAVRLAHLILLANVAIVTQSKCADMNTQACVLLAQSNPDLCKDSHTAETVCPGFCHKCPIECYHCNITDHRGCITTRLCAKNEVCMQKVLKSSSDGHHEYQLSCERKELCDGGGLTLNFGKRDLEARDVSITCCNDNGCNYPAGLGKSLSSSTPARLTTTATSTAALSKPITTSRSIPGSGNYQCGRLRAPRYGFISCGPGFPFYVCNATCYPGNTFPNGQTTDKRECDTMDGVWFDPPGEHIPDCQLNQCKPLPAPRNSTISCGIGVPFFTCTTTCDHGYTFPNGLTTDKRDCDQLSGKWFDPPGTHIPDCQPNECKPLPAPRNSTISCSTGFPFFTCTTTCDHGYTFPNGLTTDKRECDQMFGEYFDPPGIHIPDCQPRNSSTHISHASAILGRK